MLTGFGAGWALAQMGSQTEMDTGSRIARPVPAVIPHHIKPTDDDSRLVTSAFGVCVVRAHRAMVERVLALPRFGKGTWHAFAVLADEKCLNSGTLAMPTDLLRGSLYAALYAIDFRVAPSVQITEPLDYKPDVAGAEPAAAQSYLALHDFGDCVVRADTATTRALVLSPVGSAAEGENFARLASRFSGCIVQGQTITFSKSVLSAVLAETLYRSTKAAVAASTTVAPPAIPVR
ncbi:hypothetical protein [Sphingomonas sp. PR090111-T3T-6A]|uniref:hypothetical protein n=1 Tax=Sphingomonas sp. PR090111-T3T-6A TaxID=685778 RepID=UPI00138AF432|nr:hypothetical protein [Sphingomonas sp. PR090111-T3T-6A]